MAMAPEDVPITSRLLKLIPNATTVSRWQVEDGHFRVQTSDSDDVIKGTPSELIDYYQIDSIPSDVPRGFRETFGGWSPSEIVAGERTGTNDSAGGQMGLPAFVPGSSDDPAEGGTGWMGGYDPTDDGTDSGLSPAVVVAAFGIGAYAVWQVIT